MHFDEIVDSLVDRIAESFKFSREEVAKVLMKTRDANKPDFCMFLNQISKNPADDAKELYETLLKKNFEIIKDIKHKDTLISFNLNKEHFYKDILLGINRSNESFGENSVGKGKTVVVDFSSPNIAKIFHVGHFRTTVLGNFIVNLLRATGHKAIAFNYLGDWGKQFGLVLLGYEQFGSEEELAKDPIGHLLGIYVKVSKLAKEDKTIDAKAKEIFRAMEEDKNEEYLAQWSRFRKLSIEKYKELYKKLNIEFDEYSGESLYNEQAKSFVSEYDICTQDEDGSYIIDCNEYGNAIVQKNDGTTLYIARDIVSAIDRIKTYGADRLLYVVGSEQDQHFNQLFKSMTKLGYDRNIFKHINYGMVKGMSTRNGTAHFLEEIIENSADVIKKTILSDSSKEAQIKDKDATALNLAITTLLTADFGAKRIKGYVFDIDKRANCESGSGAYLQYAHCRLLSIEQKNAEINMEDLDDIKFDALNNAEIMDLTYKLCWYENVINLSLEDFEPSRIVVYLMDLAKNINYMIPKMRVMGEEPALAKSRLLVLRAARIVMRNAMKVLGIQPLEKM
ncbi:arginyl-tRNA synthetase [Enteropsectra breve]|nr:arginyl-tRNA synthetase [Enteropsectra breve]